MEISSSRLENPRWFSHAMVLSPDVMIDLSVHSCTRVLNLVERSTKFSTKYLVDLDLPRYSHVYSSVMCVYSSTHTAVHGRSTKFTAVVSGYSCVYTQRYKYSCPGRHVCMYTAVGS